MCGIFGFSAKANASKQDMRIALQKFKILGLYNEQRGKDSCGVYINDVVKKGTANKKLFSSFIESEILEVSVKNRVFLGHNRQASGGYAVSEANQHPIVIEDDMHFTHNGTLKETWDFCKKYELDWSNMSVDTRMLALAFYKHGTSVLENYKGAAALAITYKSKPNSLYLYHGSSLITRGKQLEEERPLFYLEAKEGLYYSSLGTALDAIREQEWEIALPLDHNKVIEVMDGAFTGNDVIIDRGEMNLEEPPKVWPNSSRNYRSRHGFDQSAYLPFVNPNGNGNKKSAISALAGEICYPPMGDNVVPPILGLKRESLPPRLIEEKDAKYIYYFQGRHWIHIPDGSNIIADGRIWAMKKKGYITEDACMDKAKLFFFWKGHMLKDNDALLYAQEFFDKMTPMKLANTNVALELSKMTVHPVIDNIPMGVTAYKWYTNGEPTTDAFTPKFSGRSYIIKHGHLHDIKPSHKKEICYFADSKEAQLEQDIYNAGGILSNIDQQLTKLRKDSKMYPDGVLVDTETNYNMDGSMPDYDHDAHLVGEKPGKGGVEFYNRIYETYDEVERTIGKSELMALDAYSMWYLQNDSPFRTDAKDASEQTKRMIRDAVSNGITLEEVIYEGSGGYEGVNKLINLYNSQDSPKEKDGPRYQDVEDAEFEDVDDPERPSDACFDKGIVGFMAPVKDRATEEDIARVVELTHELFNLIEELYGTASELDDIKHCEESREMAFRLYAMIDSFEVGCKGSKLLSESKEFKDFFSKLEHLKELKDKKKKKKDGVVF